MPYPISFNRDVDHGTVFQLIKELHRISSTLNWLAFDRINRVARNEPELFKGTALRDIENLKAAQKFRQKVGFLVDPYSLSLGWIKNIGRLATDKPEA